MESTVHRISRSGKLRVILFITVILMISTRAMAQKVSISGKHVSLEKVLKDIRRQTGHNFICKGEWVERIGPITIDVKDASIPEVLDKCLEGRPFAYKIADKTITVYPVSNMPLPEGFSISGTVISTGNKPLDGASVVVQRSRQGAITDARGRFTLKNIRPTDTLNVSFIGYNVRQVALSGQTEVTIVLKDASNQLDEVIMQAYSKSSERFITGNITRVTAKEIEKQSVMNPLLALQGRVPGLVVTPISGFASSPVRMEIRGINSLNTSVPSDPLYVIDGVPLTVLSLGNSANRLSTGFIQDVNFSLPSGTTTNGQSPLFSINPQDIESIEVLKDADATAVYGARGSNGVILITTKKGQPGKMKFDLSINPPMLSMGKTTRRLKLMDTKQYLQMRREAFKNDGITPSITNAPDLMLWDTTRYTDWQKEALGGVEKNFDISAGLSGGSEQTSFRINTNYNRRTNTTNISGATERLAVGSNINSVTRDQKFSVDLSANFSYSHVNVVSPVMNPIFAPNAPPVFDQNGNPNWAEWNANGLLDLYPFGRNLSPANPQSTTTLTSSLHLAYKPFKGLTLSAVLGYNFAYNSTDYFRTIASQNPYRDNLTGGASFNTTHNSGWTVNPQVTYNTRLGKGSLQFNVVATEQVVATNGTNLEGGGYKDDILLGTINNAGTVYTYSASSRSKNASLVGGVSYNWDGKYIVNLNGTRQGSSKFGPDNKYGNFGSVGAAWIASEEKWMSGLLPSFVSFLKFRSSYGLTGSDGVADYQYLALWQIQSVNTNPGGYNDEMALTPTVRPNQRYKWENNRKFEVAMNLGLLQDRVSLSVDYYKNRISDQLTSYPTPAYINAPYMNAIVTNVPLLLENRGWEGAVTAELVNTEKFSLSANFNISRNRNILVAFPDLENTPYAGQYAIGQSVNTQYVYHFVGVDPLTGVIAFKDYNNDGIISNNWVMAPAAGADDRGKAYDLQPRFAGGFGLSGNYKKLTFGFFFTYKKQLGRNLYASLYYSPGAFNQNLPPEFITGAHWQKAGDISTYPAFTTHPVIDSWSSIYFSDLSFTDASFIRLNNANISYPLPEAWGRKIGLKHLTVSLYAQNILTITRYKGGDPETQALSNLPPAGLYTIRFSYNF